MQQLVIGAGGVQIIGQADHQAHVVHRMLYVPWELFLLIIITKKSLFLYGL